MEGFDKIRNMNLAELGDHDDDDQEMDSLIVSEDTMEEDAAEESCIIDETDEDGVPKLKKTMADPVGTYYRVDADITNEEMRNFLLGHTYRQPITYILYILAILFPIACMIKGKDVLMALFVSVMIIVYYPLTIFMRSKKVMNTNKTFANTFHYMFDEVGCHLEVGEQAVDVEWKYFHKILALKSVVVIYTSKVNGYLIPTKDMGASQEEIVAFLKKNVGKK